MSTTSIEECPQCKKEVNNSTNRLVQDMCGHKKCRTCLLQDDVTCKICQQDQIKATVTSNNTLNVSVIKYDGNHKLNNANGYGELNHNIQTNLNVKLTDNVVVDVNRKKVKQKKAIIIPSHILTVTKSPTLYRCTICSKSFRSSTNIKYHSYCNGLERPLKCSECVKSFITQASLDAHMRSHTGSRPYGCEICNKRFIQKGKLNRHLKLHTGDLQYVCSECGKKFNNKDGLAGHFRLHTGEKPFACNQCSSRFRNKSNLNKHLATHSKEKAVMCDQCGKKFLGKWSLAVHKKIHSTKKPFRCEHCPKAFLSKKDLKRHVIIHGDTKMFSCTICSTKFRRKDNLHRHIKNTHSESEIAQQKIKSVITSDKTEAKDPINMKANKSTEIQINTNINEQILGSKDFKEKPNAINVIKSSNDSTLKLTERTQNAVPVITGTAVVNGPFKLAFKTDTFKHNYNIHNRDYPEPTPHIKISKPYNMVESLNICQRILSPMNVSDGVESNKNLLNVKPKNVIMSVGKVNEKDSLEICKKILSPYDAPLHYETSFENKKHASIKNIKFKLPSTYTNNATKTSEHRGLEEYPGMTETNCAKQVTDINYELECNTNEYTELQPVRTSVETSSEISNEHQSVIVNPHINYDQINSDRGLNIVPPFNEMHWRKRTCQFPHPKKNNIL